MEGKDKVMNDFMSNFQTFVKQMKINCKPPKTFKLSWDGEKDPNWWVEEIKNKIMPGKDVV